MTRTSTAISAAEAARLTGVDKSTITRAVKDGKFSAQKDINGRLIIEPAELFRVFPPVSRTEPEREDIHAMADIDAAFDDEKPEFVDALADAQQRWRFEAVRRELEEIRRERDKEAEERIRERRTADDTIADLRRRLDSSEEERRKKDAQVTHLLTDQREKAVEEVKKAVAEIGKVAAEAEKAAAAKEEAEKAETERVEAEKETETEEKQRRWRLFGWRRSA